MHKVYMHKVYMQPHIYPGIYSVLVEYRAKSICACVYLQHFHELMKQLQTEFSSSPTSNLAMQQAVLHHKSIGLFTQPHL